MVFLRTSFGLWSRCTRTAKPDGEKELFGITAGVLQGNTLATFLRKALRNAVSGREAEVGTTLTPRRDSKICNSTMSRTLEVRFFIATIESILLYGCEAWTLTQ
jgi:Na+/glutamate symporter